MKTNLAKRIIAMIVLVIMLFSTLPLSIFAADSTGSTFADTEINDSASNLPGILDNDVLVDFPLTFRDVSTIDELQTALVDGIDAICITEDMEIDRTFYITNDTIIYCERAVTLTRSASFTGDMFVVGQNEDLTLCENGVIFSLGSASEHEKDVLTINGNSENMTASVVGTVIFVTPNSQADLYGNLVITNNVKTGNERTLQSVHKLSNSASVGGAVAIISDDATMNVYGGVYSNNSVSTTGESIWGGAFYNFGNLNIYDAVISGGSATRAGAIYNYRTLYIYGAEIKNNTATTYGGAIYLPASSGAKLYLGLENEYVNGKVVFSGNSATTGAGAIYCSGAISGEGTTFESNSSTNGGAIYASGKYANISLESCSFVNNSASEEGGAIRAGGHNSISKECDLILKNVDFSENTAKTGAAISLSTENVTSIENTNFVKNVTTSTGGALQIVGATVNMNNITLKETQASSGSIHISESSNVTINKLIALDNTVSSNGGVIYATSSTVNVYNSTFRSNVANAGAGVYMYTSATGGIYASSFIGNSCNEANTGNAATAFIYTGGTDFTVHSCNFVQNTSNGLGGALTVSGKTQGYLYNITGIDNSAGKGGFIYITSSGTVVTMSGITVSGNTASGGGPIMWGNTTGAKLFINKDSFTDLDKEGLLDDAYWAEAIVNKLTVTDTEDTVPSYTDYSGESVSGAFNAVIVKTLDELEKALSDKASMIRIAFDIAVDRTILIDYDVTLFSTSMCKIYRADGFLGDLFAIGKEDLTPVNVSFGLSDSSTTDYLIIDGSSKDAVDGRSVLLNGGAVLNIYENATFTGANTAAGVITVSKNAELNVYGGCFKGNTAKYGVIQNNGVVSIVGGVFSENIGEYGGAIYNNGTLTLNGGVFSSNTARLGGAIYNRATLTITSADISENLATENGGAIYMYKGTAVISDITISSNNAVNGGAMALIAGVTTITNVAFERNGAELGGALHISADADITASQNSFTENQADIGGAVYTSVSNIEICDSAFVYNKARLGGAFALVSVRKIQLSGINASKNTATENGGFLYAENSVFGLKGSKINENAADLGGGVYLCNSDMSSYADTFTSNIATEAGAIYSQNGSVSLDKSIFTSNHADYDGGAIVLNGAYMSMSSTEAMLNSADNDGGFLSAVNSEIDIIGSMFVKNSVQMNGGALALNDSVSAAINQSAFKENSACANGGAILASTEGSVIKTKLCVFESNSADRLGGAVYASDKSVINLYTSEAIKNKAERGGFLYLTDGETFVTVNEITVSENAATTGPVIYGTSGSILHVNKENYTDTARSDLNSSYFASAFYGTLTVKAIFDEAPDFAENGNSAAESITNPYDVSSALELEQAIARGEKYIRIIADFEIDRTFYITRPVTIFSTSHHTLTRACDFGGDIFVIGEDADGKNTMLEKADDRLVLGNSNSTTPNLLVFDGNEDNMTVDVCGSLVFVSNGSAADFYHNVTVKNFHKNSNLRSLEDRHSLSRPNRVGGSLAIIAFGTVNIYGGSYINNSVRNQTDSSEEGRVSSIGGLFYNESNLRIYDGLFQNNQAARGAIVYNYCMTKIFGGSFVSNIATTAGGVYYAPNSASSHLNIGFESDKEIIFKDNVSQGNGGVIYSSTLNGTIIHGNTIFEGNKVIDGYGGAIYLSGMLTARNVSFISNSSSELGGAICLSRSSEEYLSRMVEIDGCNFDGNSSKYGGALALYSADANFDVGAIATVKNSTFTSNKSTSSGAAIYTDRKSKLDIYCSVISGNSASSEAGAIYVIGQSTASIYDSALTSNTSQSHGGAISVRSSYLNINNTEISSNSSASGNAGALYISYTSSIENNSIVNISGSVFKGNYTPNNGGAIYATRRAIDGDTKVLNVKNTDFVQNISGDNAGAVLLTGGVDVYMKGVTFVSNSTAEKSGAVGGAIYVLNSKLEIDGGVFTKNSSISSGGAIKLVGASSMLVLNNVSATKNEAGGNGGFIHNEEGTLKIYNSHIKANKADDGGAIYLYENATAEIYSTEFDKNTCSGNGAALFVYTYGGHVTIQDCKFNQNVANGYGGALYVSGESLLDLYNNIATDNSSKNGGFMYETKAGTVVTLVGLTHSGNTSSNGGDLIWGNTQNADLYINKSSCIDTAYNGELGDEYWSNVIKGSLTILNTGKTVPTYKNYVSSLESASTNKVKNPVLVSEIFDLALNSSDASIDKLYDKLPVLDNSSNFMSNQTTFFENINGETVSVDTYVYENYSASGNMNVGQGLMIYQAMLYKQANPDEEVYIDIASYRFSVEAAVNINRDSRYFGYMRQLATNNYDQYGFVRISYLLVSAAKMGIHVNVMGHSDAYPLTGSDRLATYFTKNFDQPCDPSYVKDGVVGDYMTFSKFDWTLGGNGKGGTDMMHVKLCAVSHYLDMNGVAHKNAVWTSSSNLDGIYNNKGGYNANWKQQTATIISNHEEIYNVATNYLRLLPKYQHQEGIIEFQNYINAKSTEQIDLILAGKANQISKDEQIVYIGSENDEVFEFYFTPFAGEILSWSEIYNPYCKYLRELYESEDYIVFTWNAAEYSGKFPLAQQIERMIIDAFHNNKNPKNKIYANMESFDASTFDDLVEGVDIGYKSINKWAQGSVHNKDLQFSYVKDGQRYYVSLFSSCNLHSGSMYYQPNQALVIKEKTCSSNSVFSTLGDISTTADLVEHTPGETLIQSATAHEHGCKYAICQICGEKEIFETIHNASEWIVDKEATDSQNGIRHTECTLCGELMETQELLYTGNEFFVNMEDWIGKKFTVSNSVSIDISKAPVTFEATIQLSKSVSGRGGVIVSNYGIDANNAISIEVYNDGRVRLFFVNQGMRVDCLFNTDVRSDDKTHVAITVNGQDASLYVNGELAETKHLSCSLPNLTNDFKVGGDNRPGNAQYFKGIIYSVALFSDVRTATEVANDAMLVLPNANSLVYSEYFTKENTELKIDTEKLNGFAGDDPYEIKDSLNATPNTIEATVKLPSDLSQDIGLIIGNSKNSPANSLSLEIINGGLIKLGITSKGTLEEIIFSASLKADTVAHIAVTLENGIAALYINGEIADIKSVSVALPTSTDGYLIGGDVRYSFKGEIYSINLFDDVRALSEIAQDMILVSADTDGLLASLNFNEDGTVTEISGQKFDKSTMGAVDCTNEKPLTFEAIINVPKSITGRAGVIISNYDGTTEDAVIIEIIDNGRPRLCIKKNGQTVYCIFDVDIRSDGPVHLSITFSGSIVRLYVNGVHKKTMGLTLSSPDTIDNLTIGGDERTDNAQYFKGTIYSVALFNDVRTADEIKSDAIFIPSDAQDLIYQGYFAKSVADKLTTTHKNTEFIVDVPESSDEGGFGHYVCTECNKIVKYVSFVSENQIVGSNDYTDTSAGIGPNEKHQIDEPFSSIPLTYEALIHLPKDFIDRAGVIMGNYDASANNQVNIEIYNKGTPRLYYKVGNVGYSYVFKTDIRSDKAVHLAITIDGLTANLYINGVFTESVTLTTAFPKTSPMSFAIGADNRATNPQTFKGTIYSASMFSDVRTADEIKLDTIMVASDTDNLLFSQFFVSAEQVEQFGPWAGTNAVFVGDSITYGTGCDGKTYWEILSEAFKLESAVGMGVGGSCISQTSNYGSDHSPLINRLDEIPTADLITIFMGTNDYGHDTPLGSIEDTTDVSFYGALNVIIPTLLERNPDATIVFITPLHRYGYGTNSATGKAHTYDYLPNGAGHSLEDYVNAIKEVCEKYSVDVIDLYELSDLDPSMDLAREQYMEDGLHPNATGHNYISQILEYWLNEIGNAKAE